MQIEGKKAVVFGGASGMGRATAELFASKGASVAVLDREGSDGPEVAKALGGTFMPVDVLDYAGTEQALDDAVTALGGLDISVTTAGGGIAKRIVSKDGPHDLDEFRQVLDLNIVATFNITRLAAFRMTQNEPEDDERGVIVNTSSIAAYEGQIGQVAYTAAKAAIAAITLPAARDLGSLGVRVTAIAPSLFETGVMKMMPEEMKTTLVRDNAFPKRMGRPEEYARLALAIVENPMLNGQCIRLDAGVRFAPK
ncbi:MAG TPA: SDR family NAD(P)-dependent oxidoreductase [Nocardioides sp.]|nr:SDR family NAD(P)-dependent oxidoreductase [Nocardioides sp.]